MKIPFTKCHANGNDFILFMNTNFPEIFRRPSIIERLCDRHTGVGADGLFVISPSKNCDYFLGFGTISGLPGPLIKNS